jgi:uncharacterized protein YodC (DUF2158 family)
MVFKVGDMVVLKSGGPIMTVTHVDKKPVLVHTTWFTDRGVERAAHWPPAALEEHHPVDQETSKVEFKKTAKPRRETAKVKAR